MGPPQKTGDEAMRCFASWKLLELPRLKKTSWMIFYLNLNVREKAVSYVKDALMCDAYCVAEGDL